MKEGLNRKGDVHPLAPSINENDLIESTLLDGTSIAIRVLSNKLLSILGALVIAIAILSLPSFAAAADSFAGVAVQDWEEGCECDCEATCYTKEDPEGPTWRVLHSNLTGGRCNDRDTPQVGEACVFTQKNETQNRTFHCEGTIVECRRVWISVPSQ